MQLGDLLSPERIRVPLQTRSLREGIRILMDVVDVRDLDQDGSERPLRRRLEEGRGTFLGRVTQDFLVLLLDPESGQGSVAALGIATEPLEEDLGPEATGESEPESAANRKEGDRRGPRILLVLRLEGAPPGELAPVGRDGLDFLSDRLGDPRLEARLLEARSPREVLAIDALTGIELTEGMRVQHVMVPLSYRVFSDTPLDEVVELMARRGLRAVPVVGKDLEVLGMVTAGEALKHALQLRGRPEEVRRESSMGTVRDVMSRAVMCVAEDQPLMGAAQLMVNKDVGQLPVVREGEIVGILTRDAVLKALFGARHEPST